MSKSLVGGNNLSFRGLVVGLVLVCVAAIAHADIEYSSLHAGAYTLRAPTGLAFARSDSSAATIRVGIRRDQLTSDFSNLASAGLSAAISQTVSGESPTWHTELWSRQGRHAEFRFDPVGRTGLYRAYHPENPGIWTIVSTTPTEGPMPTGFVVADCGGGDGAPEICRSTMWLAPDLMVEYSYDARDLARRGEIEQYLAAQIRSWLQPD